MRGVRNLLFTIVFGTTALAATGAAAATYAPLHSFCATGSPACSDGSQPSSELIQDETGTLYGVAAGGGTHDNNGVVFALVPDAERTHWTYQVLYDFCARPKCNDGAVPRSALVRDAQGRLYGTTTFGGRTQHLASGAGVVYRLTPNARHTRWKIAVLYRFCVDNKCTDGGQPQSGLTYVGAESGAPYDGVSPLYGTTFGGGANKHGVAFALSFPGGVPAYNAIYNFCALSNCADGGAPATRLTSDASGNLYGTGIFNGGEIFKLSPSGGGSWSENVLYNFCSLTKCADGYGPSSAILRDAAGNLYGTTVNGGAFSNGSKPGGTLYKITAGGSYSVLKSFCEQADCADGGNPLGDLAMDGAGTIYGTTSNSGRAQGDGHGVLYSMGASYQVLHKFCTSHGCPDGYAPVRGLILDASGHVLGTASSGGANGQGVVFEYAP